MIQKSRVVCATRNTAPISEGAGLGIRPSFIESGQVLTLPRIRRSPCDTQSAALRRERLGTVE